MTSIDGSSRRLEWLIRPESLEGDGAAPTAVGAGHTIPLHLLLTSVWLTAGLFSDGWAHQFRSEAESFLTPWHYVLYSGLLAVVLSIVHLIRPACPPGTMRVVRSGVLAGAAFALGGAIDVVWHALFGVEVALETLLSPPHTILFVSGLVLVTTSWRLSKLPVATERDRLVGELSLWVGITYVSFWMMYNSPLRYTVGGTNEAGWLARMAVQPSALPYQVQIRNLSGMVVVTSMIAGGILLSDRTGRRGRIALPVMVGAFVLASCVLGNFSATATSVPVAVAWTVTLLVVLRLTDISHPAVLGATFALLWLEYFAILRVTEGVVWTAEVWAGASIWAGLAAGGLAYVSRHRRTATEP